MCCDLHVLSLPRLLCLIRILRFEARQCWHEYWACRRLVQLTCAGGRHASQPGAVGPSGQAGPPGAFETGREAAARELLFNRIAPVYDQVRASP